MSSNSKNFFTRFTRSVSEFLILAIITEQGESYSYEIQQKLMEEVFHERKVQNEISNQLLGVGKAVLEHSRNPTPETQKDILTLTKKIKLPFLQFISDQLIEVASKDDQIIKILAEILDDAKQTVNREDLQLNIWNSATAIYQVINNLEKQKLIENTRTVHQSGHTRKYFKISEEGKIQALRMWLIMGDLYQIVTSKINVFQGSFPNLFKGHQKNVLMFINALFPKEPLSELVENISLKHPYFHKFIEDIFPSIGNDYLLLGLVSEGIITEKNFNIYNLSANQEKIFKQMILKNLKSHRDKIDENIKKLEEH